MEDNNHMDIEQLKLKAEQGDLESQKELFKYYYSKELVSHTHSFFWLKKAADQGDIESLLNLAVFYAEGKGCEQDFSMAEEILIDLEKKIDEADICSLKEAWAKYYLAKGDNETDQSLLFQYSREGKGCSTCGAIARYDLCKRTCPHFMQQIAIYCKDKEEYLEEYNRAVSFFKTLAVHGDVTVPKNLWNYYLNSYIQSKKHDSKEMLRWLEIAAEQDAECQYFYAFKIEEDKPEEALKYYTKAAESGEIGAIRELAHMYENGHFKSIDINVNIPEALKWYLKAAKKGDDSCMLKCAIFFETGTAGDIDYDKSMEWYIKAAEAGNSEAMVLLGQKYEEGIIVARDYSKAMEWYNKSAEKRNVLGMRKLGEKYEEGILVKQDYAKAFEWYNKSFNKDSRDDLALKLAYMNEYGLGTEQNTEEALKLYKYANKKRVEGAWEALVEFNKRHESKRKRSNLNDTSYYDDPPSKRSMLFTHGRMTPCPRCGSENIETFIDGTAVCHNCKRWYAYA